MNYPWTDDGYMVYFQYSGISYLMGEIIRTTSPDVSYVLKPVENTYGIQQLFDKLGLFQLSQTDFFNYQFNKNNTYENNLITRSYELIGNVVFNSDQALVKNNMNLKLVSRKKIFSVKLLETPKVTEFDPDIFSYVLNINESTITINDDSSGDGNNVAVLSYDQFDVSVQSTSNYSQSRTEYKNNKFSIEKSGNDYDIYCYEIYDDIIAGDIDVTNGIIFFNNNLVYYPDYNLSTYISTTLTEFLDLIMEDTTIYQMNLVSKNNIANLNNINESFDTDDIVFILPNLNQVKQLTT